jgi:glycosyltransferase involved in cell wall biosynthesis
MIIGIDGNEANVEKRVGVHQYAYEILWAIYNLHNEWKGKYNFVIYLKNFPNKGLPKEISGWNYQIIPGGNLWIVGKLTPYLIKNVKPDVFFSPGHYLPIFPLIPKICTIHDLGYLNFSEQFRAKDFWQLKIWTAISLYISKYIIAVSEFTKKDIVRHYPFTSNKIEIAHNSYDPLRFNNNINENDVRRVCKKLNLHEPYILFLSTLKPSKNIEGLLEAYSIMKQNFKEKLPNLVIAGKKGWLYETIFKKVKELQLDDEIVFTGFVDEGDKPALIKGARALISPSYWEGFGIHILEAMACGVPVVVSNVASIPEVVEKAGIYVDPKSPKDIAQGIERVLSMGKLEYNKLVEAELREVKRFSWERSARVVLSVIEKVGKK